MYGALIAGAGLAFNAYGEHEGIKGIREAKRQELNDQRAFDEQRQAKLGHYLDTMAPVGQAEASMAQDEVRATDAAVRPAAASGAAALGIQGRSPITARSRFATRGRSLGRRIDLDQTRQMGLDSDLGNIEQQRQNLELTYPDLEREAGKQGQEFRRLGGYLGAAGQAVNAGEMLSQRPQQQQAPRLLSSQPQYQAPASPTNVATGTTTTNDLQDRTWLWGRR